MKSISTLIITLCCISNIYGQYNLTSQAIVNNFEGYTEFSGTLFISGGDITDLSPLSEVTYIGGDLILDNLNVEDLSGFASLDSIGMGLFINSAFSNPGVSSLNGLNNLKKIGTDLEIVSCHNLIDMNGLNSLEVIGNDFRITNCSNLQNLNCLENLSIVENSMYIDGNQSLAMPLNQLVV